LLRAPDIFGDMVERDAERNTAFAAVLGGMSKISEHGPDLNPRHVLDRSVAAL
jgi:hypothetical protein